MEIDNIISSFNNNTAILTIIRIKEAVIQPKQLGAYNSCMPDIILCFGWFGCFWLQYVTKKETWYSQHNTHENIHNFVHDRPMTEAVTQSAFFHVTKGSNYVWTKLEHIPS